MRGRIGRRGFLIGTGVATAGLVLSRSKPSHFGTIVSPTEFFSIASEKYYGSYPVPHLPENLRVPNTDGSCVHLATAVCLHSIGEYEIAKDWVDSFSNGEYASRHIRRMESKGLLFAVETDGNSDFLDFWTGRTQEVAKRVLGVTYNRRHVLNLVDIDSQKAYLLNNQRKSGDWNWDSGTAHETPRQEFIINWDRNGGWAFCILGTQSNGLSVPNPPIPYV